MIDKTEAEQAALAAALKPVSEAIGEIGWDKPASQWTQDQVLAVVEAAVDGFGGEIDRQRAGVP